MELLFDLNVARIISRVISHCVDTSRKCSKHGLERVSERRSLLPIERSNEKVNKHSDVNTVTTKETANISTSVFITTKLTGQTIVNAA